MRPRWYERILFFLTFLLVLAVALGCLGLLFFPQVRLMVTAQFDYGMTFPLIAVGAIALILAVFLLAEAFSRRRKALPKSVTVRNTEVGVIDITLSALDTLAQKSARSLSAVRDCVSQIVPLPTGEINVLLRLSLMPETNVPEVTAQLQTEMKDYIQTHSGVTVRQIQVTVESTGINPAARVQ